MFKREVLLAFAVSEQDFSENSHIPFPQPLGRSFFYASITCRRGPVQSRIVSQVVSSAASNTLNKHAFRVRVSAKTIVLHIDSCRFKTNRHTTLQNHLACKISRSIPTVLLCTSGQSSTLVLRVTHRFLHPLRHSLGSD